MDFNEFSYKIEKDITKVMKEQFPGAGIKREYVRKLQDSSYFALLISPANGSIGMNINLNLFYGMMQAGKSYEHVSQLAVAQAVGFLENVPEFELPDLTDYETVKNRLFVDLIGTQKNREMVFGIPHKEYEDMSLIYRIKMESGMEGFTSTYVTYEMLEDLGIDEQMLHNDALENAARLRPAEIINMFDMFDPEESAPAQQIGPKLYIVTMEGKTRGAGAIFYPGMLEQCAEIMEGSFYILPSSVHEMIVFPDDGRANAADLQRMVVSANAESVADAEQLTDNVYHYDIDCGIFESGEHYEERLQML